MTTTTIHRLRTSATDDSGKRVKFETFDARSAALKLAAVKARDPQARILHIPVTR